MAEPQAEVGDMSLLSAADHEVLAPLSESWDRLRETRGEDLALARAVLDECVPALDHAWPQPIWAEEVFHKASVAAIAIASKEGPGRVLRELKLLAATAIQRRWNRGGPAGYLEAATVEEVLRLLPLAEAGAPASAPSRQQTARAESTAGADWSVMNQPTAADSSSNGAQRSWGGVGLLPAQAPKIGDAAFDAHAAVTTLRDLIATERGAMRASWVACTEKLERAVAGLNNEVREASQKIAALDGVIEQHAVFLRRLTPQVRNYQPGPPPANLQDEFKYFLVQSPEGGFYVRGDFLHQLESARLEVAGLVSDSNRMFGFAARRQAALALDRLAGLLAALRDGRETEVRALKELRRRLEIVPGELTEARTNEAHRLRERGEERLSAATQRLDATTKALPGVMQPWSHDAWRTWHENRPVCEAYAGTLSVPSDPSLGDCRDFAAGVRMPLYVSPMQGLNLLYTRFDRDKAHSLARSLIARTLASHPPGTLQLSVFDPISLGQAIAPLLELAEYEPALIGGKVWTATSDLKTKLADHVAHIELVIQKYLRSDYASLEEFNEAAGEVVEPFRLLTIFDFPEGFDEEAVRNLRRIIESGPRCGVAALVVSNAEAPPQHGHDPTALNAMPSINLAGSVAAETNDYALELKLEADGDTDASPEIVRDIVARVGAGAQVSSRRTVRMDKVFRLFVDEAMRGTKATVPSLSAAVELDVPSTWWSQSTIHGVFAPIGQTGARDVAVLPLDSADHSGALLVGRPGAGKSTLLHAFLMAATTLYSPLELELYLIDFKEGVEFKAYATHSLPHARAVAIESDREFGLSVLEAIDAEIVRRGALLRTKEGAHASLESLRSQTDEALPRIVLVFDEFQQLFEQSDRVASQAADRLERIVRQGRGFGVHVILGSQSLSGLEVLGSHVPQLLPVRILLAASDVDAARVLGPDNAAGKLLNHAGEGILNPAAGAVEANQPFLGAFATEDERLSHLGALRARADELGFSRVPVVFEGNAPLPAEAIRPQQFIDDVRTARGAVRIRFGAPMAIAGTADIALKRESGANILVVARHDAESPNASGTFSLPVAVISTMVASAVAQDVRVQVVDFLPFDDGLEEPLAPYVRSRAVALYRARQLQDVVSSLRDEVRTRVERDDSRGPNVLLILFGLHRARSFSADALDADGDGALADSFDEIVREGPEVGCHVAIWSDTVSGVRRRIEPRTVREIGWRIAGKMSGEDSESLVGVEAATALRPQQLLLCNEDAGILQRCTAFSQPSSEWATELLERCRTSSKGGM
jgi:hypothetical protein